MVFVGVAITLLYFPLMVLVEKLVASQLKAVLLLLSGVSILLAVFSILVTERWSISAAFWGGGGAFSATFRSPGVGLLFAAASSAGLIVLGAVIGLRWVLNVCSVDFHKLGVLKKQRVEHWAIASIRLFYKESPEVLKGNHPLNLFLGEGVG